MERDEKKSALLKGLLADEIGGIIQYVASSGNCDKSDHSELHKSLMEMHNGFPGWVQQRIVLLNQAPVECTIEAKQPTDTIQGSKTMSEEEPFGITEAKRIGDALGIPWDRFDVEQFTLGLNVELEHRRRDPQTR